MAGTGKSLVAFKAEELLFGLSHGSHGLGTKLAQNPPAAMAEEPKSTANWRMAAPHSDT